MSFSIALSKAQQYAILGYSLTVDEFFLKASEHIDPSWFSDIYMANTFKQLKDFYEKYKMLPKSEFELLSEPYFRSQGEKDVAVYLETVKMAKAYMQNFTLDVIRSHLANFVKTIKARSLAKQLIVDINRENYEKAINAAEQIATVWREVNFDPPKAVDFNDLISMWTQTEFDDKRKMMSTGSAILDKLLGGGLEPGGNLAVLAPTFLGKSRFLLTLLRHLLVQGKKVLFLLHEDSPAKVRERLIGAMIGLSPRDIKFLLREEYKQLFSPSVSDEERINVLKELSWRNPHLTIEEWDQTKLLVTQQLYAAQDILKNQLFFIVWQKAGQMFVEDVLVEIRRIQNECRARFGNGLDAIISDYPALLRSRTRHEHERARLSYVYQCFNDIAAELNAFCAYAVQVNRNASKALRQGERDQALGLEDVSESYQIAMNAMAAISLNRLSDDYQYNILRIAIIKSRDAQAQKMLITRSSYKQGSLYGDYNMYTKVGQMLIEGLKYYEVNSHDLLASEGVNRTLEEQENVLSHTETVARSQAPALIKKLLGWGENLIPLPQYFKEKQKTTQKTEEDKNDNQSNHKTS